MRYAFGLALGLGLVVGTVGACGSDVSEFPDGDPGGTGNSGGSGATGGNTTTTSNGGSANGGNGAGGSSSGGSGGGVILPECITAEDCTLGNDCCACEGLAENEMLPPCNIDCLIDKCTELMLPELEATCEAGQCVAGFACDHSEVLCEAPQPQCPPGETSSVNGVCWGPCVPIDECATVTDCADCDPGTHVCVEDVTQLGPRYHCVPLPPQCNGDKTCACMGSAVCVGAFNQCVDGPDGISCNCPTC